MSERAKWILRSILLAAVIMLNTLVVVAVEPGRTSPAGSTASTGPMTVQPTRPAVSEDMVQSPPELESSSMPNQAEPSEGSVLNDKDDWREADSFESFCKELNALGQTGGKLRLTKSIKVPADVVYDFLPSFRRPYVELDLGRHTISVEGKANFYFLSKISGNGGDNGLFSVKAGGLLHFSSCSLEAESGFAIRQEAGAALLYGAYMPGHPEFTCVGAIEKAPPLAVERGEVYTTAVLVPLGKMVEDCLPTEWYGTIIQDGEQGPEREMPVQWDTDAFSEELTGRDRFTITGRFTDFAMLKPIQCVVAFEADQPATLLSCGSKNNGNKDISVYVDFALSSPNTVESVRLEWSADGEHWSEAEEVPSSGCEIHGFVPTAKYPVYLSLAVTNRDGSVGYSDVVVLRSADGNGDMGGNRHGGTGITPPALPPAGDAGDGSTDLSKPESPDNANKPEDTEAPGEGAAEKPDEPALPNQSRPPDDTDKPGQGNPPDDLPEQVVPPTGQTNVLEQNEMPVTEDRNSFAKTEAPVTKIPVSAAPQSSQAEEEASSGSNLGENASPDEIIKDSRAQLAAGSHALAAVKEAMAKSTNELEDREKPKSASTKVAVQVAIGLIVTGGIFALTMTWGRWSKKWLRQLQKMSEHLFERKGG